MDAGFLILGTNTTITTKDKFGEQRLNLAAIYDMFNERIQNQKIFKI
jgi:hypothetical protein